VASVTVAATDDNYDSEHDIFLSDEGDQQVDGDDEAAVDEEEDENETQANVVAESVNTGPGADGRSEHRDVSSRAGFSETDSTASEDADERLRDVDALVELLEEDEGKIREATRLVRHVST